MARILPRHSLFPPESPRSPCYQRRLFANWPTGRDQDFHYPSTVFCPLRVKRLSRLARLVPLGLKHTGDFTQGSEGFLQDISTSQFEREAHVRHAVFALRFHHRHVDFLSRKQL